MSFWSSLVSAPLGALKRSRSPSAQTRMSRRRSRPSSSWIATVSAIGRSDLDLFAVGGFVARGRLGLLHHPEHVSHVLRDLRDGGRVEEAPERKLHAKRFPEPRGDEGREQGVSAELEEIVVYSDFLDPEHFLPDRSHAGLDLVRGSDVGRLE